MTFAASLSAPATATSQPLDPTVLAAVAAAVAPLVPASVQLTAQPATAPASLDVSSWAAGAGVDLGGPGGQGGRLVLLVGSDLTEALAAAPSGGLDLASALQPALDAGAAELGAVAAAGRTLGPAELAVEAADCDVVVPLSPVPGSGAVLLLRAPRGAAGPAAPSLRQAGAGAPGPAPSGAHSRGVELLHGVAMDVTVELGRTRLAVRDLLALAPGDVLELDRAAGSPADLLVNGRLIARGEVVVVDENFALRVTEILAPSVAG
jgi:flagellar motor switch protein FliN/FliY